MFTINNYNEVMENLAELLKQFDIDENMYQTDVYMYVDESGNATIDTFTNVGGNSWLNDNHYTIYTDKEHYEGGFSDWVYNDLSWCADVCGTNIDAVKQIIAENSEWDVEDIDDSDIYSFLTENEKYSEILRSEWIDWLNSEVDYETIAENILNERISEIREFERMQEEELKEWRSCDYEINYEA